MTTSDKNERSLSDKTGTKSQSESPFDSLLGAGSEKSGSQPESDSDSEMEHAEVTRFRANVTGPPWHHSAQFPPQLILT